nr:efflux RND transporter periplasmic adaptor subunit [Acuticoccus sediminis]
MAATGSALAQWGNAPPPAVDVVTLQGQSVPVVNELPGRIAATRVSEVRARVSGILQERIFEQGTLVQKGETLFRIDPALFEVRVASAQAALQRAEATHKNAALELKRQESLRDRKVNSIAQFERASVAMAEAEADVAAAEAQLDEARINLGYTEVMAPITGIIGGALVTEGALVTANGPQNMALIQQIDPVYADFTQSSAELFALKRAVEQGKLQSPAPGQARVQLVLDDGALYPHPGKLLFSSASVDPTTGQVTLRAEFPNPKRDLLPGLYIRVRIVQAVRNEAIVVPQRAVVRSAEGAAQVYIIKDEVAELRAVSLGEATGSDWVVESGLQSGDVVVVNGTMKVQPGGKVSPQPWQPVALADGTGAGSEAAADAVGTDTAEIR